MMVKVLFYGYVWGIRSSQKLAAECRENIGFMKLCQGEAPDFRPSRFFGERMGRSWNGRFRRWFVALRRRGL